MKMRKWIAVSALLLGVLGISSCKIVEAGPTISKVTPDWGLTGGTVTLIIEGSNFKTDITATLSKSGLADIAATALTLNNDKMLTAVFSLSSATVGAWDMTVTNSDGKTGRLTGGFSIMKKTILYVAEDFGNRISVFNNGDAISGAATPDRTLTNAQLGNPFGLVVDSTRDILYAANRIGSRILSFNNASTASGATAPSRTIASLLPLSHPYGICLDNTRDELYVTSPDTNTILVFAAASSADGSVIPARSISGSAIVDPVGLFLDQANNRLYVANSGLSGCSIAVFENASTLSGSVTPTRQVTSSELNPYLYGVFVDTSRKLLYVVVANGKSLLVYANADQVSGAATPAANISLSARPDGLYLDGPKDLLFVTFSPNSIPNSGGIFVFENASTLTSASVPVRTIINLSSPAGIWGVSD